MTRHDDDDRDGTPFDDILEQMDAFMRQIQQDMFEGLDDEGFAGGYSFTQRPGEEPEFTSFGDLAGDGDVDPMGGSGLGAGGPGRGGADARQGHVEVHREDDTIRVVGDFPGVAKGDIDLSATPDQLRVQASNEDRDYAETVSLPAPVDPDSATARYNNGVLEVAFTVEDDQNAKDIDIE